MLTNIEQLFLNVGLQYQSAARPRGFTPQELPPRASMQALKCPLSTDIVSSGDQLYEHINMIENWNTYSV